MGILTEYLRCGLAQILLKWSYKSKTTITLGKTIQLNFIANNVVYECSCQELIYTTTNVWWFVPRHINRLYRVTARCDGSENDSVGIYPALVPKLLNQTFCPFTCAIQAHCNTQITDGA